MNIYSAVDELSHRGYSVVRDFLPLSRLDPNLVQQLWSTDRDRTGVITDIPEGFKSFLVPFVGDLFNSLNPLDLHLGASRLPALRLLTLILIDIYVLFVIFTKMYRSSLMVPLIGIWTTTAFFVIEIILTILSVICLFLSPLLLLLT